MNFYHTFTWADAVFKELQRACDFLFYFIFLKMLSSNMLQRFWSWVTGVVWLKTQSLSCLIWHHDLSHCTYGCGCPLYGCTAVEKLQCTGNSDFMETLVVIKEAQTKQQHPPLNTHQPSQGPRVGGIKTSKVKWQPDKLRPQKKERCSHRRGTDVRTWI